jgi:hypothetical protein
MLIAIMTITSRLRRFSAICYFDIVGAIGSWR